MKTYTVNSPLQHDGKDYRTGEIELSDEHAAPLLQANVISEIPAAGEENDSNTGTDQHTGDQTEQTDADDASAEAAESEAEAKGAAKASDNVTPLRGDKANRKK